MKNSTPSKLHYLLLMNFLANFLTEKKISDKHLNLREPQISVDEIRKPINYETNHKSSGNDGLTAKCYKHFSN